MNPLFLSFLLLLTTTITTTATTPKIGVTFDTTTLPNLSTYSSIVTTLIQNKITTVHLINPTPSSIHSFQHTNISLLLTIPNTLLHSFATNQSDFATWISTHILPFHKTTRISLISINATTNELTLLHLSAFRSLYSCLHEFGILKIRVSVTVPFQTILDAKITPFNKQFNIRLLLNYLDTTNSSFLVNLQVPSNNDNFFKLFDEMVETVYSVLSSLGENYVPVIIAETKWPSERVKGDLLKGLMDHLWDCGFGGLVFRKKRVGSEFYVYELFGEEWGIMDKDLRFKYELDFSGFEAVEKVERFYKWLVKKVLFGIIVVCALWLQYVWLVNWFKQ